MLHVSCSGCLLPSEKKQLLDFCWLPSKNIFHTSTDLLQNSKTNGMFFCFLCCRKPLPPFPLVSASGRYSGSPCLSRRSEYKYELRLALLSDEWSCQPNSASFQSRVLPLIPHSRSAGSCENWKWQSNQHVEQADWTKLSWPRSELFNTSGRQRLPLSEHPASLCAFGKKKKRRKKREGGKGNKMRVFLQRLPGVESVLIQVGINTRN